MLYEQEETPLRRGMGAREARLPSLRASRRDGQEAWHEPEEVARAGPLEVAALEGSPSGPSSRSATPSGSRPKAERPTTTVAEPTAPHDSDRTEDRHGLAQVENLVCYLANLSDDLDAALASGRIASETLPRLARDLRRLADEIETGRAVPQVPYLDDFDDVPF